MAGDKQNFGYVQLSAAVSSVTNNAKQ